MDYWKVLLDMAASIATVLGIVIGLVQLRHNYKLNVTLFEDQIAGEYRESIKGLPYSVFAGKELPDADLEGKRDDFYRYFDFTNGEIQLRKNRRISKRTWDNWKDGIKDNLSKVAFRKAYEEITRDSPDIFHELKRLEIERFEIDPAKWKKTMLAR